MPGPNAAAINEVLRGTAPRDRHKVRSIGGTRPLTVQTVFKFSQTDTRNPNLNTVVDTVQTTLKASAPGLLNSQVQESNELAMDDSKGSHRNLIAASPFNAPTLFQPTLAFIERACATLPQDFDEEPRSLGGILEEFVVKVFLPQLDQQVTASFQRAVSGHDAEELDLSLSKIPRPPQKVSALRLKVTDLTVEHACPRSRPQPLPHAGKDTVPQGKLQSSDHRCHCAVLSTMQHTVQGSCHVFDFQYGPSRDMGAA